LSAQTALTKRTWRFRLLPPFFGLNDKYVESVYEEIFLMKYHGGWSFIECYNLPIKIRRWFLERLVKEIEEEAKQMKKANKKMT
tara:strand:- start:1624 stop:1875 length:252 start_codon:yes stop_codon:yes gene_type:complete